MPADVDSVSSGPATIHCESSGSGQGLVAVHGGPGLGLEPFKPSLFELDDIRRITLYDQRGCGKSSRHAPDLVCPLEHHLNDLKAVITSLHNDGPVDLLGHSFGAHLACLFALSHPGLVRRLILISPVPPHPESKKQLHAWYAHFDVEMRKELTLLNYAKGDADELANRRLQIILPLYFKQTSALEEFRKRDIEVSGLIVERCAKYQQIVDLRDRLDELSTPLTILCGAEDKRTPPDYSRSYLERVETAEFHLIEACGHFPFMEQSAELVRLLRAALEDGS